MNKIEKIMQCSEIKITLQSFPCHIDIN